MDDQAKRIRAALLAQRRAEIAEQQANRRIRVLDERLRRAEMIKEERVRRQLARAAAKAERKERLLVVILRKPEDRQK